MSKTKLTTFTFETKIDGKKVELMARRPNMDNQREGQKVYNRAFNDAVSSGALLRAKLDDFMREQGMWDDKKQERITSLGKEILHLEQTIAKGGIRLSVAREKAIDLRKLRFKVRDLISERTELDVHTAEGQADNARFNYWVTVCVVYNDTQKPVFSSVDDYLSKQTEDYAALAAGKLASLLYNLSEDYDNKLEENKFLREFGFADKNNRLINDDGHLVDENGRLIDEEYNYVNEQGQRVDIEGNLLNDEGNYVFDRRPFLDDDDNPVETKKEEPAPEETRAESVAEETVATESEG